MDRRNELDAAVNDIALAMLGEELKSEIDVSFSGEERMQRRQAAAAEICRRAGILNILQAISPNGVLNLPPKWPLSDVVPVGGGEGFLNVEVRTMTDSGLKTIPLRLSIGADKKLNRDMIAMAYERGKFELSKLCT